MKGLSSSPTRRALPGLLVLMSVACGGTVTGASGDGNASYGGGSVGDRDGSIGGNGGVGSAATGGGIGSNGASGGTDGTGATAGGGDTGGGRAGSSSGDGGTGSGGAAPNDAMDALSNAYTVWLGETDEPVTYPEFDLETAPQRILLILDPVQSDVTGTVTFGTRPPPDPPSGPLVPYPPRLESWPPIDESRWLSNPYDGFEYTLVNSHATGTTLSLEFAPVELLADSCPDDPPAGYETTFCECPDYAPASFSLYDCQRELYGTYLTELTFDGGDLVGELRMTHRDGSVHAAWVRLSRIE